MTTLSERRKLGFWRHPITISVMSAVIVTCVLIPVNFFSNRINSSLTTPEQIEALKIEITNNNEKFDMKLEDMCKDIQEMKIYKNDNEKDIIRFEKAITRLETLVETLSKKLAYNQ